MMASVTFKSPKSNAYEATMLKRTCDKLFQDYIFYFHMAINLDFFLSLPVDCPRGHCINLACFILSSFKLMFFL